MKTKIILSAALLALMTACSSNDNAKTDNDNKGKVDIAQGIEFKVNVKDFNAEKEYAGTRAAQKPDIISRKTVDLGNNLLAEVTVQRDTTKTQRPATATRALDNDTYTMLVFKGSFPSYTLEAQCTGTLKDGKFTPGTRVYLDPGKYIFVLHNSRLTKVTTSYGTPGLKLTRENADKALIGQTEYTVTATPDPQYVDFEMSHVGCRMRIKLTGWMPIQASTTASLQAYNTNLLPKDCTFELPYGGDKLNDGELNPLNEPLTFPASATTPDANGTYTTQSNEYLYFVPGTDMEGFKLTFTGGQIYKKNMAGVSVNLISLVDPDIHSAHVMDINESYLVNINLKYNFLYLMSDGTTDFINSTQYTALRASDGKTKRYVDKQGNPLATPKVPIAVVASQSKGIAIALKDANGGNTCEWDNRVVWNKQVNYKMFNSVPTTDMFNDMEGYKYSWEISGSSDGMVNALDVMAYWRAGEYLPGVSLTGSLTGKKWHLPSIGEWKYVYTALSLGDASLLTAYFINHPWNKPMPDLAFTQVGGTALANGTYWSSTEYSTSHAGVVSFIDSPVKNSLWWTTYAKNTQANVRPFIKYQ
ncbi:hypothetical protein HMPREF9140_01920 [Prevotella micans F0438]|uniref:Fibrobacter succinogenes major paralogous domain-containing protein n=1 Tax=Prevotella micans F0438 TaxID=883158 RepID=H1Q4T2_9BACT|nr:hypothetical protein [Prevotella micans]EHO66975.1 hypothetical protein HMPREF9140_01920 [Prevotella micans F0438]